MRFTTFITLYLGYTLVAFNQPYFTALFAEFQFNSLQSIFFAASLLWVILSIMTIVLMGLMWPSTTKPVAMILLVGNGLALYFTERYQVVIDQDMMTNALSTDYRESLDLLTPRLFAYLLLYAGLPCLIIARIPILHSTFWRGCILRITVSAVLLTSTAGVVFLQYKDFSTYLRVHRSDQNLWIPRNYLWGLFEVAQHKFRVERKTVSVGLDAQYRPNNPPILVVMVVGETARAANFSLYGYPRETNPKLAQEPNLITLPVTTSCGTSTAVSLPCMFSPLNHDEYKNRNNNTELLPIVLARLGVDIAYIGNNFGSCKGVCNGVSTEYTKDAQDAQFCNSDECHDGILVDRLSKAINIPASNQLLILHQNGSHGPRYDKRYPKDFAKFQPVCTSADIRECSQQELINGYDNTILYTDHVLAEIIETLKAQNRASILLYVSDHGESLGENGLYLHGLPDVLAPKEQTEVPFLMWTSEQFTANYAINPSCLKAQENVHHAQLFHTLVGMFGVQMAAYDSSLDLYQQCAEK